MSVYGTECWELEWEDQLAQWEFTLKKNSNLLKNLPQLSLYIHNFFTSCRKTCSAADVQLWKQTAGTVGLRVTAVPANCCIDSHIKSEAERWTVLYCCCGHIFDRRDTNLGHNLHADLIFLICFCTESYDLFCWSRRSRAVLQVKTQWEQLSKGLCPPKRFFSRGNIIYYFCFKILWTCSQPYPLLCYVGRCTWSAFSNSSGIQYDEVSMNIILTV